jgi:hypothetical protein
MKNYDFKQAKDFIKLAKKDGLIEATLGMKEDWYWTADTVWIDGKYVKKLNKETKIGGIQSSNWATPMLELTYKNGTIMQLNCFK